MPSTDKKNCYFSGEKLYGDDLDIDEIHKWFEDEKLGYYNLGAGDSENYKYKYHALNYEYGYRYLNNKSFNNVLGIGSAYGDELLPIIKKSKNITILEPSDKFNSNLLEETNICYASSNPSGEMPFIDNYFDLITCFGVLHHIPNVSKVLSEIYRCLTRGGYSLIREPNHSMGDWTKSRDGLTKRERGIPTHIFHKIIRKSGFKIISEKKCMFSLTSRLHFLTNDSVYNSKFIVKFDHFLCSLPIWPDVYHPKNSIEKFRPVSTFYVLKKI